MSAPRLTDRDVLNSASFKAEADCPGSSEAELLSVPQGGRRTLGAGPELGRPRDTDLVTGNDKLAILSAVALAKPARISASMKFVARAIIADSLTTCFKAAGRAEQTRSDALAQRQPHDQSRFLLETSGCLEPELGLKAPYSRAILLRRVI